MNRGLALKVVLGLVGFIFLASAYPLVTFMRAEPALSMMFSLYVTLGVFLLLAIRRPSESRNLIAFTAWSSLAHAGVMGLQALRNMISRGELLGVALLAVIGIALIVLAPPKESSDYTSALPMAGSLKTISGHAHETDRG
jgi:FtsH-binding integral membrane protein